MTEDEQKQRLARDRGEKARAILESPAWSDAWEDFERFIFEQFRKTESRDVELLAHWKRMHVCGIQLKAFFERTMADGEFAAKALEFQEKRSKLSRVVTALRT